MSTNVQNQGTVLGSSRQAFADGDGKNLQANKQGALLVANSMPGIAEATRLGSTFSAGTVTAVAPVAALPTTASHLSLYAPSTGTASLLIHNISFTNIASAGAAIVEQLIYHVTTVSVASITGSAAQTPKNITGANAPTATIFSAVTTVNNGNWAAIGPSIVCAGTANIACGGDTGDITGRIIVKPGMHLDLAVFCSAAASATCAIYVTWTELVV